MYHSTSKLRPKYSFPTLGDRRGVTLERLRRLARHGINVRDVNSLMNSRKPGVRPTELKRRQRLPAFVIMWLHLSLGG